MNVIKTLLAQVKQYKTVSILTPIFTALEVFMEILIPFVISAIIDKGIEAGDMQNVYFYGSIMVVLAILSLVFGILAGRFASTASTGFAANLRDAMYENIQNYSFSNIDKYSTAGLVTRMTTDVTNVQNAYQMCMRIAVRSPLTLICSLAMAIVISLDLSFVYFIAMVFLGIALMFIMSKTTKIFSLAFKQYDAVNADVQENVTAIRVVKAFVREKFETAKFNKSAKKLYDLFVKAESILAFNGPIMMLTVYGCVIAISWFGAQFVVSGSLTTGELTSMFSYIMNILMSLMMLSMIFVMISMSTASARRIAEVLNEKSDIADPKDPILEIKDGSIEFDNVFFAYKHGGTGEDTLKDLTFKIESGETIGLVGGTGSGKSSLVNLISRLYDVSSGSVKVGGHDVRSYDLEALRDAVSVVLQKNVLFSGTILDNLRWGNEDASEEECIEACRLACADDFIQSFPDKYETWIEQGGTNVSGGQKQRLCIARALLKKPKILILDDSTSAVDTATDAKIREAFATKIPDTTKIIIAQRVTSVKDADRIIVLKDGEINGIGTHNELVENNPIYKEMYETQTQGGGDFDEGGD